MQGFMADSTLNGRSSTWLLCRKRRVKIWHLLLYIHFGCCSATVEAALKHCRNAIELFPKYRGKRNNLPIYFLLCWVIDRLFTKGVNHIFLLYVFDPVALEFKLRTKGANERIIVYIFPDPFKALSVIDAWIFFFCELSVDSTKTPLLERQNTQIF